MANFRAPAGPIRELSVLAGSLLAGLLLLPFALFFVSKFVLGNYGGGGYAEFFATLLRDVGAGQLGAWILIIAPYPAWQVLRLSLFGWTRFGAIGHH